MAPMSVHDHDKYKNDRLRKKLGQQHRSKSECREPEEEKDSSQPGSSQKSKKNEKVKKRQATVPNPNIPLLEKEHASRTPSSFSCCQCHHPSTPTTDETVRNPNIVRKKTSFPVPSHPAASHVAQCQHPSRVYTPTTDVHNYVINT